MNKFYLFMLDLTLLHDRTRILINAQSIRTLQVATGLEGTHIMIDTGSSFSVKESMDDIIKKLKKLYIWPVQQGE